MHDRNGAVERMAAAVPEQRRDLELSLRSLSRLSGVHRETISRLERGGRIDPVLLVRVAATLSTLEQYSEPAPDESSSAPLLARPPLATRTPPRLGELPPLPYEIEVDGARQWVAPAAGSSAAAAERWPS